MKFYQCDRALLALDEPTYILTEKVVSPFAFTVQPIT